MDEWLVDLILFQGAMKCKITQIFCWTFEKKFNDLLQQNAVEFNFTEIKHWSWLETIFQCPQKMLHLFHFYLYLTWKCLQSVIFFIIILFFKLQFTLMMRKALTAHCKKIINIQRPDKDKSFLLVHNIKSSQHQIKPVGEKFVYSPKEAKLNSYCWMWKHIYSVLGEWSLDLLLVNALSGSICSS